MDFTRYDAFLGWHRIASGSLETILPTVKAHMDAGAAQSGQLLIFQRDTGKEVDFNLSGSIREVLERALPQPIRTGPGRPKLGVVSREVSLLPRHWEWLESQGSGSSATLRRLVEEARKRDLSGGPTRAAIDATGRFMTALAGNLPGFEEAYRALYARDRARLTELVKDWPEDVRNYVLERFDGTEPETAS
jgi:hypothetical protein